MRVTPQIKVKMIMRKIEDLLESLGIAINKVCEPVAPKQLKAKAVKKADKALKKKKA